MTLELEADPAVSEDARWRRLFEGVLRLNPNALVVFAGEDLRVAWANEAYRRMLERGAGEPVGRTFAELWPADRDAGPVLRRVRETGRPEVIEEHERRYTDGRSRWCRLHADPVPWGDGTAVLSILLDIEALRAARLAAERAAGRAAARATELEAAVSAMADGFILCDRFGRLRTINDAARRLLGVQSVRPGRDLLSELDAYAIEDAHGVRLRPEETPAARALRGETVRGAELLVVHVGSDDPPRWVSSTAMPVRARSGELLAAVVTFTDVTPLREMHEEREDLVRTISHDLRTPLGVVRAHAQLLAAASSVSPDVARRAEAIRRSADRMSAMLNELVETIRLESGHAPLAPAPIEVEPFLRELVERLHALLPAGRVEIEPGAGVVVQVDPGALERMVVNLITNAAKYSPADAPVTVRFRQDGRCGCIDVVDRGPGIPSEEQRLVFDRFYRRGRDARAEGLGLGLFITRLLATKAGGKVRLASAPGAGSTFTLVLPLAPTGPAACAPGRASAPGDRPRP